MRYRLLACDYDGTLANLGRVDWATLAALERLRTAGWSLALVTGRQLEDLQRVFHRLDLFDRVVAENGALLYRPSDQTERILGDPPPPRLVEELGRRGVTPLVVGRVIVATVQTHKATVLETIRDLGIQLQLSFNMGAVMILPCGIDKASGLQVVLEELRISAHNAVGVGDAENDQGFLALCGCSVAVANGLPGLKERADYVTGAEQGAGVVELIDRLLAPATGMDQCD